MPKYLLVFFCLVYIILAFYLISINFGGKIFNEFYSEPLYQYSVLLFILSFFFVIIIVHKSRFLSPSLFLFLFFIAVPLIGPMYFEYFIERYGDFYGRQLPSFAFPTFIWSIGTFCFFTGDLLAYFLVPGVNPQYVVIWDRKRMLLFLKITLTLSIIATIIAIYRIGYLPLMKQGILGERVNYVNIVGPFVYRFTGLWLVSGLLSSMLFFLEKTKRRYLYLLVIIASAIGKMMYAQRTGFVLILFCLGLLYIKFSKVKILHILLIGILTLFLIYMLMIQGGFRGAYHYTSFIDRIKRTTFGEWAHYSTVIDEIKSNSDYLGWRIFLGPFLTLLPRQIYSFFGYDKMGLIEKYSAVYYYGREFDNPYGVRITPIGEAFAGYGTYGVIFQLMIFGIFFGAFEKIYMRLKKQDARLFLILYFLSSMLYLPISTLYILLAPLIQTGLFVFAYYILGTIKCKFDESHACVINDWMFASPRQLRIRKD